MHSLINHKVDNCPKYVCLTVIIDITRKITKFVNLSILMGKGDVITVMSHHFLMIVASYVKNINIQILLKFYQLNG